jgi:hypothetical protein
MPPILWVALAAAAALFLGRKKEDVTPVGPPPGPLPGPTQGHIVEQPTTPAGSSLLDLASLNVEDASALAPQVLADLKGQGHSYNRELMQRFQKAAGLIPDGDYGPATRGALENYVHGTAPAAMYGVKHTGKEVVPYTLTSEPA